MTDNSPEVVPCRASNVSRALKRAGIPTRYTRDRQGVLVQGVEGRVYVRTMIDFDPKHAAHLADHIRDALTQADYVFTESRDYDDEHGNVRFVVYGQPAD